MVIKRGDMRNTLARLIGLLQVKEIPLPTVFEAPQAA
jgi:hypothetical protein